MRILVVDDEKLVSDALSWILGDAGFDVMAASDWAHARRLINALRFDAIVTDLQLPAMREGEIVAHLRGAAPSTPILAMSGDHGLRDKALAEGACTFLPKPSASSAVLTAIADIVARPRPAAALPNQAP